MCFWSHGQLFSGKSNIYLSSCLSVCLSESSERPDHWTNPHQIWYGGLTLQGPGHRLCFGPGVDPRGQGGPKQGLERIYSLNRETRQKFYKTKVVGNDHFRGGRIIFLGP